MEHVEGDAERLFVDPIHVEGAPGHLFGDLAQDDVDHKKSRRQGSG
jgi:hypothetical protein